MTMAVEHVCSECTYPPRRHPSRKCCDDCCCYSPGLTVAEEAAGSVAVTGIWQER